MFQTVVLHAATVRSHRDRHARVHLPVHVHYINHRSVPTELEVHERHPQKSVVSGQMDCRQKPFSQSLCFKDESLQVSFKDFEDKFIVLCVLSLFYFKI